MLVSMVSVVSGKVNTLNIPGLTEGMLMRWQAGEYIQDAMPGLTPVEREFLLTGVTPEEWDEMFPEDEEEME